IGFRRRAFAKASVARACARLQEYGFVSRIFGPSVRWAGVTLTAQGRAWLAASAPSSPAPSAAVSPSVVAAPGTGMREDGRSRESPREGGTDPPELRPGDRRSATCQSRAP